jgi:hypothetical protein
MARHVDRDRIRQAKLTGAAARLRDLAITQPSAFNNLRSSWPEIAQRIDRLIELVDWDQPTND